LLRHQEPGRVRPPAPRPHSLAPANPIGRTPSALAGEGGRNSSCGRMREASNSPELDRKFASPPGVVPCSRMKHLPWLLLLASAAYGQERVSLNTITKVEVKGTSDQIPGSRKP